MTVSTRDMAIINVPTLAHVTTQSASPAPDILLCESFEGAVQALCRGYVY